MAQFILNKTALRCNYEYLKTLFEKNNIQFAIVSKLLCGTKSFLKELVDLGVQEVADSRVTNLERIKKINPDIRTIYIKPPAKRSIRKIVQYADVSCNSELQTILWLNEEAKRQNKIHNVLIMIEMGDLREGVMGDDLMSFYASIFELEHIHVIGLGTNLNCLHGVMPSSDKLVQLGLYKQLIESKFGQKIEWVSGGTSVVLPLLFRQQIPASNNHFRIGETLYFGNNLFTGEIIPEMRNDVFRLKAEIIEITDKPKVPFGELATNPSGEQFSFEEEDYGQTVHRAIVDIGILDVNPDFLFPINPKIKIGAASSDMLVVEIPADPGYAIGSTIEFRVEYMAALRLLNSFYIEKIVVEDPS
ncbi:ornithine racemase Orr [Wandonia haliotis]|uniref:Ornithine racemase Orr n=1 Tax=Wandonia haliotis TaxID=574963 RepID=A0ABP3Y5S8_9FLAO